MGKRVTRKSKLQFADLLKQWRACSGISQAEAAALINIPVKTLQNWEIARTMPRGAARLYVLSAIKSPRR